MADDPEGRIEASTLMRNLSRELLRLTQIAQRLDDGLGALAGSTTAPSSALLNELQEIDALRQALAALQKISATGADELSPHPYIHLSKATLSHGVSMEKVRNACLHRPEAASQHLAVADPSNQRPLDPIFFDEA